MRLLTHIVTPQEDDLPVKHLLQRHFALSSTLLKSVKWREGGITCNGHPVTVSARCRAGDRLTVDVSDPPCHNPNLHPVDFPLSILWEDEDLLILNKPAGITVHCAALTREPVTVAGAVAHYLHSDQYHGVNRLDRGTTGVMVVAKTGYIHARCMALLHSGDFYREYRGICLGTPLPQAPSTCPSAAKPIPSCSAASIPKAPRPTRITKFWRPKTASPSCAWSPKQAAPTSSAFICLPSAIPWSETGSTAPRINRFFPARPCIPMPFTCAPQSPAKSWMSPRPSRRICSAYSNKSNPKVEK